MGILSYTNKFSFVASDSSEKHAAAKSGLQYDGSTLQWVTRKIEKAVKLRRFADQSAERKFKKHYFTFFEAPKHIVSPSTKTPKTFQLESAKHILTRSPAYCADEAGLGKTLTSILAMQTVQGRTLIVCPPYLKYTWFDELKSEYFWCTTIKIIEGNENEPEDFNADIIILPDSLVTRPNIRASLEASGSFKWLFLDEAHRIKAANAQRTEAILSWVTDLAERVVFLSSTPMPNRAMELFTPINGVAPETFNHMSEKEFGEKFCKPTEVERWEYISGQKRKITHTEFKGTSNHKELNRLLTKTLMIRHEKKDVLKDLPPKTRKMIFLDQPGKVLKCEKELLKNRTMAELLKLDDDESFSLGDVAKYRRECGEAKLKQAIPVIIEAIENSKEPIIVFAHHIAMIKGLELALQKFNPIIIRGGLTPKEKDRRVKEFQAAGNVRPIIGNIDSMGVGLTLTRAWKCIFFEYSWVDGINEQAEDRLHRISQGGMVLSLFLVLRESLDERMLHEALKKRSDVKRVIKPTNDKEIKMTETNFTLTIPNITAAQASAIMSFVSPDGDKGSTSDSLAALATKGKRGSSKKKPAKTVSPDEDEDFGEDALEEDDLELADENEDEDKPVKRKAKSSKRAAPVEEDEDEDEEEQDEDELDFDTVKSLLNKYAAKNEAGLKTILSGFGIKSTRELENKKSKWQPVYDKVQAKMKAKTRR